MGFVEQFTKNLERFEWERYKHSIYRDLYRELVQIVTDAETTAPDEVFYIDGKKVKAQKVAEVFSLLECEHLQSVCEKYDKIGYPIRNKQTYLRAMLYNEVFEYQATVTNDVNVNEGLAGV